ncbi:uroporphyrinogen-III C-methyltransferase [Thalassotalea piscium]
MTDKKTPDSNLSSDKKASKSTDNTKATSAEGLSASISLPPQSESEKNIEKQTSADTTKKASTPPRAAARPVTNQNSSTTKTKIPLSKTAVVALIIALLGVGGIAGIHWLHSQQLVAEEQALQQKLLAQQEQTKVQVAQLFKQKGNALTTQINSLLSQQAAQSGDRIDQLEQQLGRLQQTKSTDWLVNEAEYLIRISSRTLWLEKNTSVAISLLKDADARLKELNDPQYLPVRQAIRNDIESLQLLPVIDNESLLLSLNALNQQVNKLPLAMVKIPDMSEQQENFTLSEDTSDWQANLAKTWHKFLSDFITVRRRTGSVEPLMAPQHQQNLRENLMLKLQVAQWAITKRQSRVYQQTLQDITAWLTEYFDMTDLANQHFLQSIQELQAQKIDAQYPTNLSALSSIRSLIEEKPLTQLPALNPTSTDVEVPENSNEIPEETTNKSENN